MTNISISINANITIIAITTSTMFWVFTVAQACAKFFLGGFVFWILFYLLR